MSDIIAFEAQTPRLALPLLYPGQAQKEVFINEALVRIDALLHARIEAVTGTPPASPVDGQCWIVGAGASGDWTGRLDQIACRTAGNWIFVMPREGMSVTLGSSGRNLRFQSGNWTFQAPVPAPAGGATVDSEARAAISALIARLVSAGILSAS